MHRNEGIGIRTNWHTHFTYLFGIYLYAIYFKVTHVFNENSTLCHLRPIPMNANVVVIGFCMQSLHKRMPNGNSKYVNTNSDIIDRKL